MKKSILILITAVGLFAYPAFAQTISVTGQSLTASPGTSVGDQLTLTITGANTISNVESVNMLLKTFAAGGGLNGASFFTISGVTPTSPFTLVNNGNGFPSAFNTAGDASNSSSTVSDGTKDIGSNAPSGSAPTVGASGTTTIPFETVTLSLAANTPVGVYNFSATAGGFNDNQGSYISNTSSQSFDLNSEPTFTITVVPEPATWSLFGLGALGALGLNLLRVRRKA